MQLHLENVGKITKADIELNGITIIAGENNTGKSTVSKALYSTFNGLYNIDKKIDLSKHTRIELALSTVIENNTFRDYIRYSNAIKLFTKTLLSNEHLDKPIYDLIVEKFNVNTSDEEEKENLEFAVKKINQILNLTYDEYVNSFIEDSFLSEFNKNFSNIFSDDLTIIDLTLKNKNIKIKGKDNKILEVVSESKINAKPIYIDNFYIIDDLGKRFKLKHNNHNSDLLKNITKDNIQDVTDKLITNHKLDKINKKINEVCAGNLVQQENRWDYKFPNSDKKINIASIATGMKTFLAIKKLLQNGTITDHSLLILDEPEIHLHPKWQLLFAEIIVLLQKEFDLTILINTHSPYFLEAIEVYALKYNINEKCKYYLAENEENIAVIKDVTHHLEKIYDILAQPFQTLENAGYDDDL